MHGVTMKFSVINLKSKLSVLPANSRLKATMSECWKNRSVLRVTVYDLHDSVICPPEALLGEVTLRAYMAQSHKIILISKEDVPT